MENIKEFIDGLSNNELNALLYIINNHSKVKDIRAYIHTCLNREDVICSDIFSLLEDIPMSYLPIVGIGDHRVCDFFSYVYDYVTLTYDDKLKIKSMGPKTIVMLDQAISFLQQYLDEELTFFQSTGKPVRSGKKILDRGFIYKKNILLSSKNEILDYFAMYENEYVFSPLTKRDCLSEHNIENTFSILAMYSHMEDLRNFNIEHMKKFVKIK